LIQRRQLHVNAEEQRFYLAPFLVSDFQKRKDGI
jgi:hypothetical protein